MRVRAPLSASEEEGGRERLKGIITPRNKAGLGSSALGVGAFLGWSLRCLDMRLKSGGGLAANLGNLSIMGW